MELIPAIDLRHGRVVRLRQGDFQQESTYGIDPVAVARRWEEQGARRLHVVDLDGAHAGRSVQAELIQRIMSSVAIPCQVGGGIRKIQDARRMLRLGADRVILGTGLLRSPTLGGRLVAEHGADRIVSAIDIRDGAAVGSAWSPDTTGEGFRAAIERLLTGGVRWFAVTSIERDGMLTGPDLATLLGLRDACPEARIIASGGISTVADLRALADAGLPAAILGRSLYEGSIDLAEALAAMSTRAVPASMPATDPR